MCWALILIQYVNLLAIIVEFNINLNISQMIAQLVEDKKIIIDEEILANKVGLGTYPEKAALIKIKKKSRKNKKTKKILKDDVNTETYIESDSCLISTRPPETSTTQFHAVLATKGNVKTLKTLLENLGIYDKKRKIHVSPFVSLQSFHFLS